LDKAEDFDEADRIEFIDESFINNFGWNTPDLPSATQIRQLSQNILEETD